MIGLPIAICGIVWNTILWAGARREIQRIYEPQGYSWLRQALDCSSLQGTASGRRCCEKSVDKDSLCGSLKSLNEDFDPITLGPQGARQLSRTTVLLYLGPLRGPGPCVSGCEDSGSRRIRIRIRIRIRYLEIYSDLLVEFYPTEQNTPTFW